MSERVAITGGGGMMGRALASELRAAGYTDVTVLTRRDADLLDPAQAEAAIRKCQPGVLYHMAAKVAGILGNMRSQGDSYLQNLRINTNVIEGARLAGVRKVVAMGSTAVYSNAISLPMREGDIWSGAPHGSEAGYAHAKRAMLAQLEAYRDQYGLSYAYCISTNLFGPHDRFDETCGHVVPSLVSKFSRGIATGEPVVVWGSGTPQRDILYVTDAARALRLIGEGAECAINVASGTSITIAEIVSLLAEVTGFRGQVVWDGEKPDGQRFRSYDISRLRSLNFSPAYDTRDALRLTFEWFNQTNVTARG